ncbi:MAG TPA: hypothetical protein G4N92_08075 [Anaerolineae bacterium]|nr:hypothetical protein [Anaerolineae bacterium]
MEKRINSTYSCEIIKKFPLITIIHQKDQDGTLWATSGRTIFYNKDGHWQHFARFPFCFPRDMFAFSRPTSRALRSDKCNLYINSHGKIMGIRGGSVFALEADKPPRFIFNIQGDCVLHRGISEDDDGWSYFGEYYMNPLRSAVRIWRVSPELTTWEIAHQFGQKEIRHVHSVTRDPFEKETFWVTVGDYRGECYLLKSDDRFQNIQRFGDGSQNWRAVNLFFTPTHICWLTDSNLQRNHACCMARRNGKLEIGHEIDNSSWYGCTTQESIHVAFTTVERGPAITSNFSDILVSHDAFHWQKVFSFKKDFFRPMRLFKYGVITCPSGLMSLEELTISGEGLVGLDGKSLQVKITRAGD